MDSNKQFKYTVYKTTNIVNGKIYVGFHKTLNLNDDYLGSGKIFKRAIKKYGVENFKKTILFIFDTAEEMFKKESKIVDRLFVESNNTYNILLGGRGGFYYINSTGKNKYTNLGDETHGKQNLKPFNIIKKILMDTGQWENYKKSISVGVKEKIKKDGFWWIGKKHKESTKLKIGLANKIALKGEKNPMYGKCWIHSTDEKISKSVKREEIQNFLDVGWKLGRKMKFS